MKVAVASPVTTRKFNKTTDQGDVEYTFHTQEAFLFFDTQQYPIPFNLSVEDEKGYPVGDYKLHHASVTVDKGRLMFSRNMVLVPLNGK